MANIGACANVATFHGVATPEELSRTVGYGVGAGKADGVGEGTGFRPYLLRVVVRFRLGFEALLAEIHVLWGVVLGFVLGLALFP